MSAVFKEGRIAGITLANRIIRSATHDGLADDRGRPTERLIKRYEALARGGTGALITGFAGVSRGGRSAEKGMLLIYRDDNIPFYREFCERVHSFNTALILQIGHCGRQTRSSVTGEPTVAPSAVRDGLYRETPRALDEAGIQDIIEDFVSAAVRAKRAGFDGVQLHITHGYLLSSFLSPRTNRRKDRWGGSHKNRFRIVREIMTGIRERCGDFPVLAKINGHERGKRGLKTEDALIFARMLEEYGCDALEVSCGMAEDGFDTPRGDFPFEMILKSRGIKAPRVLKKPLKALLERKLGSPEPRSLYNLEAASEIRKSLSIPVITVGGIRELRDMEEIISSGRSDYVSMCRPFLMEPGLAGRLKAEAGAGGEVRSRCRDCNFCMAAAGEGKVRCYNGRLPL